MAAPGRRRPRVAGLLALLSAWLLTASSALASSASPPPLPDEGGGEGEGEGEGSWAEVAVDGSTDEAAAPRARPTADTADGTPTVDPTDAANSDALDRMVRWINAHNDPDDGSLPTNHNLVSRMRPAPGGGLRRSLVANTSSSAASTTLLRVSNAVFMSPETARGRRSEPLASWLKLSAELDGGGGGGEDEGGVGADSGGGVDGDGGGIIGSPHPWPTITDGFSNSSVLTLHIMCERSVLAVGRVCSAQALPLHQNPTDLPSDPQGQGRCLLLAAVYGHAAVGQFRASGGAEVAGVGVIELTVTFWVRADCARVGEHSTRASD